MLMSYGVITLLVCWVFVAFVHATGVETFELPPRAKIGLLFTNAALDSLYNGLLLLGILISTPLFMSVGCMLVSPIRMRTYTCIATQSRYSPAR
jgi:solute carrier family 35 protein F5